MWRTLIYYKPEHIDLAKKLQENYIAHQKDTDIISEEVFYELLFDCF